MKQDLLRAIDDATSWLRIDGVEAVADGTENGEDCILVGCSRPAAELAARIPRTFHGFPVVLEEWGAIPAPDPE